MSDIGDADFLCLVGGEPQDANWVRPWLHESLQRRLVLIDEDSEALQRLHAEFSGDVQVKAYVCESPLQIEPLARKAAWQAVFLKPMLMGAKKAPFQAIFEETHLAAQLLLSDAADYGVSLYRTAGSSQFRQGLALEGAFPKVPAFIVGGGPSLENIKHLLASFQNRALFFAGGSALNAIPFEPHIAASVDRRAPYREFKRYPFAQTPFCFQSRINPDNFSLIHGDAIWFPDGHHPFLNWLEGSEERFDGGWTVSNFLTAIAVRMGCDPIIFVGMDLCYEGERKYACEPVSFHSDHLVKTALESGEMVWTQRDWLMARLWTEEMARRYPNRTFLDARGGGLPLRDPIVPVRLEELALEELGDLKGRLHLAVQSLPWVGSSGVRRAEWKESLERCRRNMEALEAESPVLDDLNPLAQCEPLERCLSSLETEIAYEKLLQPLWQIWRPIFERELDLDGGPLSVSDKLQIHRFVFFQRVIQEHLHAI